MHPSPRHLFKPLQVRQVRLEASCPGKAGACTVGLEKQKGSPLQPPGPSCPGPQSISHPPSLHAAGRERDALLCSVEAGSLGSCPAEGAGKGLSPQGCLGEGGAGRRGCFSRKCTHPPRINSAHTACLLKGNFLCAESLPVRITDMWLHIHHWPLGIPPLACVLPNPPSPQPVAPGGA